MLNVKTFLLTTLVVFMMFNSKLTNTELNWKLNIILIWGSILLVASTKRVVCYYTNWAQYRPEGGKYFPEDIDPNLCTHVIYSFAKLNAAGELAAYEWNDETVWSKGMYERVVDLKAQSPHLKVLLAVGGWDHGSGPFSNMVADNDLRQKFVSTSVAFLKSRRFDGLDLE